MIVQGLQIRETVSDISSQSIAEFSNLIFLIGSKPGLLISCLHSGIYTSHRIFSFDYNKQDNRLLQWRKVKTIW